VPETRGDRFVRRLVAHIPRPLAAAPERVLINFACILIGFSALTTERPGSLLTLWPRWVAYEWAGAMFLGGGCALLGYWLGNRSVERLGYMLIGAAATVYAIGVIIVFGWQGVTTGILYIGIALSKLVRLLVGSAVRNAVIRAGRHPHGWTPP
jgi:hypothetical protein